MKILYPLPLLKESVQGGVKYGKNYSNQKKVYQEKKAAKVMQKYTTIAKRLQSAINQRAGAKILLNITQWYSEDKQATVNVYTVKQKQQNTKNSPSVELFKTYSQIQLVLWLRDYWYSINGLEIPTDNEMWEEMKKKNGKSTEV